MREEKKSEVVITGFDIPFAEMFLLIFKFWSLSIIAISIFVTPIYVLLM